jgi:hypothetical protein
MKLLAQSLVPVNPVQYTHLGYCSAAIINDGVFGVASLLLGLYIGIGVLKNPRLMRPLARVLGWSTIAAGCWGMVAMFVMADQAQRASAMRFVPIAVYSNAINEAGNRSPVVAPCLPANMAEARRLWNVPDRGINDAWKRPMRLTRYRTLDADECLIRSAGGDGRFGTEDDWGYILSMSNEALTAWRAQQVAAAAAKHRKLTMTDAWGRPFRLRTARNGTVTAFSAGLDGDHGTFDDISAPEWDAVRYPIEVMHHPLRGSDIDAVLEH